MKIANTLPEKDWCREQLYFSFGYIWCSWHIGLTCVTYFIYQLPIRYFIFYQINNVCQQCVQNQLMSYFLTAKKGHFLKHILYLSFLNIYLLQHYKWLLNVSQQKPLKCTDFSWLLLIELISHLLKFMYSLVLWYKYINTYTQRYSSSIAYTTTPPLWKPHTASRLSHCCNPYALWLSIL